MASAAPAADWRHARLPLYPIPLAFAASCFFGLLATDIAYWATANIMWVDFSDWLVTAGVTLGWFAVLVAVIELLMRTLRRRPHWPAVIGLIVALILATLDMLVHTRDAWTSVVPWGLILSASVVLVLLVTGWIGYAARELYVSTAEVT